MSLPQILLLDDDPSVHKAVEFRLRGFAELSACLHAADALAQARQKPFDAALIDVNLNEMNTGMDMIVALRAIDPDLAPVIFTAHTDYDTALNAFRVHAFDFVPKSLRQDEEFRIKLNEAIAHTRVRRQLSQIGGDATRLRTELCSALVRNELEVTTGDIQRGLLAESLESFSALLGRVELIDMHLHQRVVGAPELMDLAQLARGTLEDLQEYVGNLRDYFAAPESAAATVNSILDRAANIMRSELPAGGGCDVIVRLLRPDQPILQEGRALLRAIIILMRLASSGPAPVELRLTPILVLKPVVELESLKSRPTGRVLSTPDFRPDDRRAISLEIASSNPQTDVDALCALFSPESMRGVPSAAWTALAMLARIGAAVAVETCPGSGVRFTVLVKL